MKGITMSKSYALGMLVAGILLVLAGFLALQPTMAGAQEGPALYPFKLTKSISDNYTPDPFTADEFKFNVSGYGLVTLDAFTNDTAEKVIYLPAGNYTVEEVGPAGFVPADWTVQWSGYGCEGDTGNGPIRPIGIEVAEVTDPDAGGNVCKADNQWRGEEDDDDEDPDPDPTTGTLVVSKVIVGTTNVPASNFSFTYTGANGNTAFELDGSNSLALAPGTYTVTETAAPGYTTTYSNCSNVTVVADTTTTCVITNTLNTGGGGGDNDPNTYLVFGYVWHDENANTDWEMDDPETEAVETGEPDLDSWTVTITNGETTYSTVTDAAGYYFFNVPVGIWTISETLQTEWNQTAPTTNGGTHVVNVGNVTMNEGSGLLTTLWNYLVPTAYAQAVTTYGPFNFGNVFFGTGGCSSNCGGGGGNGDGHNHGNGGGSGTRIKRTEATPIILGDATTTMPVGAPNTGAGGTAPSVLVLPTVPAILGTRQRIKITNV